MPFYTSEQFGESLNILESEVGLVTKTKQATADMADTDGIIKAGTLFGGGDVYTPVETPGSENPSTSGWYEYADGKYTVSTDETPQSGTTYYTKGTAPVEGIVLEDYDMTADAAYPVAVVVAGRVRADRVSSEALAQKETFAKQGLHLV